MVAHALLSNIDPVGGVVKVFSMMTCRLSTLLAQFRSDGSDHKFSEADVMFWCGILIGLVLVGSVVIMMVRRRCQNTGAESTQDGGFSLADLRAMRDRGEITPEEYEQTRTNVIARVKQRAADSKPKPKDAGEKSPSDLAE